MGGGSKTTTSTKYEQTPEEKEWNQVQIELAKQQLALTKEQHGWNSEIFAMTKPLLAKYGLMVEQQFNEWNSPEASDLRDRYRDLESSQLDAQMRMMPIQEELLQMQLDEIRRGGRATEEQKRLIGEITDRAIQTGDIDINRFLNQGLGQIREELAPARGLRPMDSPMLDSGGEILEEAIRQKGQLTSQMRGAQANAELNFPLNASQVFAQQNQWQQNFGAQSGQFMAQQRNVADQNRQQLMSQLFTAPMAAGESGISLINSSRPNPVSFPRNSTQTQKTSGGSILGGIGGLLSGVGSVASAFSSEKLKEDVKPIRPPEGHVLSPGALKYDKRPISRGYNNTYRTGWNGEGIAQSNHAARPPYPGLDQSPNQGPWLREMDNGPSYFKGDWRKEGTTESLDPGGPLMPTWTDPTKGSRTLPGFDTRGQPIQTGLGIATGIGAAGSKPPGPDVTFDPPRPDSHGGPKPPGPDFTIDPPRPGWHDGPKPPGPDYQIQPGGPPTNTMAGPEYRGLGFANPPQTDEDALGRIANLEVSQWRYKPETGLGTEQHIGPMAEDFNTQVMGQGPNPTISVVDSLGALTSAVKALEARTRGGKKRQPRPQFPGRGVQGLPRGTLTPEQIRALLQRQRVA